MRESEVVQVVRAHTHNLKGVSVEIPLNCCVLLTGPSGSGKSSLGFGTIHAAAHAAYLEGISSYSRFTEARLATPDVEAIYGLRPTLALVQGYGGRSSRSTVGTVTDALALLRLLFSRLGEPQRSAGQLSPSNPDAVCVACNGLGTEFIPAIDRLIDKDLTLLEGAIRHRLWKAGGRYWNILEATGKLPLDVKVGQLSDEQTAFLLYSPPVEVSNRNPGFVQRFTYEGLIPRLIKRMGDPRGLDSRSYDLSFFLQQPCTSCGGTRLAPEARKVTIGAVPFENVLRMQLSELVRFVRSLSDPVAAPIQRRLCSFLDRMLDMGLGHLTVLRSTTTLSGGELRRMRIANQLNSPLSGLIYVVDEASAGLHYEEAQPVYAAIAKLRDAGNSVVLVDHSEGARNISDYVIELGPGGGSNGGRVMWAGAISEYPGSHGLPPAVERPAREIGPGYDAWRVIARSNNLHDQTVQIPRNRFVVLAGPSGAGKSSLAIDIASQIPDTILLSQRDIGRSVRSVLATYLNIFDAIRRLFGTASGRPAADFSFNGAGACPGCGGWGYVRIDMQFLEDVTSVCDECGGLRYRPEVMTIRVRGLTIADVLDMTIDEAAETFRDKEAICRPLRIAAAVGIGHLVIGQSTDTLSGGEAQRLRVATEVARPGRAVLILDEPTRGLGHDEIPKFIQLVDKILDEGRSVIAIEHNVPVIRAADWVIELGPGGGSAGGRLVAEGTPGQLAGGGTLTGRTLKRFA